MSSEEHMYFDTSDNYVTAKQVRKNITAKINSIEYKKSAKHLIDEMKLKQSNKLKQKF
jgi:aromatic ring-cleaving dioxygenase